VRSQSYTRRCKRAIYWFGKLLRSSNALWDRAYAIYRTFSTPRQYQPTPSLLLLQVLVGHPLDTIKVRIQTMESLPGQPPPYKGMGDCAQQIIKKEGVSFEYHQRLNTSIDRSACTHPYKVRTCTLHAFSHLAPCFRALSTPPPPHIHR